jgi:hypothetical protein
MHEIRENRRAALRLRRGTRVGERSSFAGYHANLPPRYLCPATLRSLSDASKQSRLGLSLGPALPVVRQTCCRSMPINGHRVLRANRISRRSHEVSRCTNRHPRGRPRQSDEMRYPFRSACLASPDRSLPCSFSVNGHGDSLKCESDDFPPSPHATIARPRRNFRSRNAGARLIWRRAPAMVRERF